MLMRDLLKKGQNIEKLAESPQRELNREVR